MDNPMLVKESMLRHFINERYANAKHLSVWTRKNKGYYLLFVECYSNDHVHFDNFITKFIFRSNTDLHTLNKCATIDKRCTDNLNVYLENGTPREAIPVAFISLLQTEVDDLIVMEFKETNSANYELRIRFK